MRDFVPEDLTTFVVKANHAVTFYEVINHQQPTTIKGAFYVHDTKHQISVFVQDPRKQIVYKRSEELQGIVIFETTTAGVYTFIVSNINGAQDITCTLALHTYD
jgi:hypothetical protein